MKQYLIVKDEGGELRPFDGMWYVSAAGHISASKFLAGENGKGCVVAVCEIIDKGASYNK